jgi:hypothetical protein
MKMSVRTFFSSGRPSASAFTRGRGKNRVRADAAVRPHGRARGSPRAWTRARADVARTPYVRADAGPCERGSARARDRASARRHASRGHGPARTR